MRFRDLVAKSRSYRRFDASVPVGRQDLLELIELVRLTPSAANRQPLKYVLSCSEEWNVRIFDCLAWAGYLPDWPGPTQTERPTAYVVVLTDSRIADTADTDVGIAAQTLLLGAVERGLGGCMFGSVKRGDLGRVLSLPEHLRISLVIALGKPKEKVVLVDAEPGESIKYTRDEEGTHFVPKRKTSELIVQIYG